MKKKIAIVCGGYHNEYEVSLKSAQGIMDAMDRSLFDPYTIIIRREEWVLAYEGEEIPVDKSDFSVALPTGDKLSFDFVYITIHGTPGEDGILQGYLDMLQIPYNTGGVLCESLTFNKEVCNRYLSTYGFRIARSLCLHHIDDWDLATFHKTLRLPVFVKPNVGGSSIATTKVAEAEGLAQAIKEAFDEGEEVLIEELIQGTEVTCGCLASSQEVRTFPVTEVVAHTDFFDFDAKYNGLSDEITPARIPQEQFDLVQAYTRKIARLVRAKGIIRVDYIIEKDGIPTLLEVNTTPGMTAQSFIPQQVRAYGEQLSDILTTIILNK